MPVTMIPVKSSNIAKIGYDALALQLNVEFKNGKTFGYKYVSLRDFDKLICANSVGKHFNALIKPDKVAFEIVGEEVEKATEKDELSIMRDHMLMIERIAMHPPVERAILKITRKALGKSKDSD